MRGIDYAVFVWINGWPNALSPFLKFFSVALSLMWVKVLLAAVLVGMVIRGARSRTAAFLALLAVGIANTLTNVWKEALPMARPFQDFSYRKLEAGANIGQLLPPYGMLDRPSTPVHLPDRAIEVMLRVGDAHSPGTASAHSANMAALALVITYQLGWKWGSIWILIALLTGVSRVYTGAHYPSQVLLGWICGVFSAFVVIKTWEVWQAHRKAVQSSSDAATDHA